MFYLASWTWRRLTQFSISIAHGFTFQFSQWPWQTHPPSCQYLLSPLSHYCCPWVAHAQWRVSAAQVERGSKAHVRQLDHTVTFWFAFVLLAAHFSNRFSQTVWILVAIKAFLFPLFLSSLSFWQEAQPCWLSRCSCAKNDKTNWRRQPWSHK